MRGLGQTLIDDEIGRRRRENVKRERMWGGGM